MTAHDTIIPRTMARQAQGRTGRLDRAARSLVSRRLASLGGGRVTLSDPLGRQTLGTQDGRRPIDANMAVHDMRVYRSLVLGGSLAAAEGYMQGKWTSANLTDLLRVFVRSIDQTHAMQRGPAIVWRSLATLWHRLRRNTLDGSRRNIHAHYDLGNEFFSLFLDPTMSYSCAIFERPDMTLHEASRAKLDHVCRKLDLKRNDYLLEIGTGWGGLAMHAASQFGCRVTTTTISKEQHALARQRIADAGLADRIEVKLTDYRELTGQYDKLVAIEMIEAVGHNYLDTFFAKCASLLTPDGMMLLQGITMNEQRYERYRRSVDFIQRYVFPGSCCPALGAMVASVGRATDMRVSHVEDIGPHYATTVRLWREAFFTQVDRVLAMGYPPSFVRLWDYYLSYCEAGFAERYIGDVQMVLTRPRCERRPITAMTGRLA